MNNVSTSFAMTKFSNEIGDDGINKTTYRGEYDETPIEVTVTSNTTAGVTYGDVRFNLDVFMEDQGIARADSTLEDGSHLAVTFYSGISFELSIIPSQTSQILTYAFSKRIPNEQTWKDYVLPVSIALILTIIIRKYLPRGFR
jgi:hypothetical protein